MPPPFEAPWQYTPEHVSAVGSQVGPKPPVAERSPKITSAGRSVSICPTDETFDGMRWHSLHFTATRSGPSTMCFACAPVPRKVVSLRPIKSLGGASFVLEPWHALQVRLSDGFGLNVGSAIFSAVAVCAPPSILAALQPAIDTKKRTRPVP